MKRIVFVLIALLLVGGFFAYRFIYREKPIKVSVKDAEIGVVEATVTNTRAGSVKARWRAKLAPAVGGRIATLNVRKGDKVETKTVQFELLRQALYELYAQLYDELSCGNIAKDCVEGACEYCDYKAICQFKGEAKKERNRTSSVSLNEGAQNEAES